MPQTSPPIRLGAARTIATTPAPDRVGALGVLTGLRRNAYAAFPPRCRDHPVLVLPMPGRDLVVASGPQAVRHVLTTRPDLYRRTRFGRRRKLEFGRRDSLSRA